MHLLARDQHQIDRQDVAVDLALPPADIVFLSFSDSDLAAVAAASANRGGVCARSVCIANLAQLRHPYSVDLFLEGTVAGARFVLVRCLGGADYWRYGIDELAAFCRAKGIALAIVPGDGRADDRLDQASTVSADDLSLIWRFFDEGGPDNTGNLLAFIDCCLGGPGRWHPPVPVDVAGRASTACHDGAAGAARALLVMYRSLWLAADFAPILALATALAARGFAVETIFVTSLKDPRASAILADALHAFCPDVVINTTAFSARDGGRGVLDDADCPVLQAPLATVSRDAWSESSRGFGAVDLAMNVVLPEVDGRLLASPISFKAPVANAPRGHHVPHAEGIAAVVDLAEGWSRLRRTRLDERKIALVLSDYPLKGGREGYAVGLDALASVGIIVEAMRGAGYRIRAVPSPDVFVATLRHAKVAVPLPAYTQALDHLPPSLVAGIVAAWGAPADDPCFRDGALHLDMLEAGNLAIAFQPDRGTREDRRADYHDPTLPPRHAFVAFYLWLRETWGCHAMIHLGTHGTLEWLPGKSVALSAACAPLALLRGLPVVYPFIVNDPGEAAQARRRLSAVTVGHLTPPLAAAGLGEADREIETLLDEYASAAGLDPRRAGLVADAIIARAGQTGLAAESGIDRETPRADALAKLDAWLCEIKDLRLGDGLHTFGHETPGEIDGLLRALDGRFVEPGPAGAPSRARQDVLPTGRNLYGVDPRSVPTRTASAIGAEAARAVLTRYTQDHGDWPRALIVDLWGSSTMRTSGEDFAQAMTLMGVRPVWDLASARVSGFEVITPAELGRPRVDVTLRISGLFRDVFPGLIDLFDQAVQAIAALAEDGDTNPLRAVRAADGSMSRVFGPAPGTYGTGVANALAQDPMISRDNLGARYLQAQNHAFGLRREMADPRGFADRVRAADALLHTQDMAETDILAGAAYAEEEGGFVAAAHSLGGKGHVYHVDATREADARVRTMAEEVARVSRGKFGGPGWIAGLMRHGHRGAGEIAEAVGNLATFAVTSGCVSDATVDLAFDATLGNDDVRAFLQAHNRAATRSIAGDFAGLRGRGLWTCRRNSVVALLDDVAREAA